jgi:hypothetical protein
MSSVENQRLRVSTEMENERDDFDARSDFSSCLWPLGDSKAPCLSQEVAWTNRTLDEQERSKLRQGMLP